MWPAEDGWPYPDGGPGVVDPEAELDEDALALHCLSVQSLGRLEPLERTVVAARFGVGGAPLRTMKELQAQTGVSRAELRVALSSGLTKLRLLMA